MQSKTLTIRKYRPSDKPKVLDVLYETSSFPIETPEQKLFLRLLYNDYYTDCEPDSCFVAADENDEAVGYILCAKSFRSFKSCFDKNYLPEIRKLGSSYFIPTHGEILVHRLFSRKYPAHLHIDILPCCQGQKAGTRLVEALCEYLKSEGVKGLMLSCGMSNKGAISFYSKTGFKKHVNFFGNCIMVKEL